MPGESCQEFLPGFCSCKRTDFPPEVPDDAWNDPMLAMSGSAVNLAWLAFRLARVKQLWVIHEGQKKEIHEGDPPRARREKELSTKGHEGPLRATKKDTKGKRYPLHKRSAVFPSMIRTAGRGGANRCPPFGPVAPGRFPGKPLWVYNFDKSSLNGEANSAGRGTES